MHFFYEVNLFMCAFAECFWFIHFFYRDFSHTLSVYANKKKQSFRFCPAIAQTIVLTNLKLYLVGLYLRNRL